MSGSIKLKKGFTVQDTSNLSKHGPDPLSTFRDLNIQELFNGKGIAEFVGHYLGFGYKYMRRNDSRTHRDIIEAIKIRKSLEVGLVFDELLRTAMKESNVLTLDQIFSHSMREQANKLDRL